MYSSKTICLITGQTCGYITTAYQLISPHLLVSCPLFLPTRLHARLFQTSHIYLILFFLSVHRFHWLHELHILYAVPHILQRQLFTLVLLVGYCNGARFLHNWIRVVYILIAKARLVIRAALVWVGFLLHTPSPQIPLLVRMILTHATGLGMSVFWVFPVHFTTMIQLGGKNLCRFLHI